MITGQRKTRRLGVEPLEDRRLLAVVTSSGDSGPGSLREALASGDATITFDTAAMGGSTITLISGDLLVTNSVAIDGDDGSGGRVTVDAADTGRVFFIDDGSIGSLDVEISNLTITGGFADEGGGIESSENLTLDNVDLSGNSATAIGGGVLNNNASLTILNSTISGNESVDEMAESTFGGGVASIGPASILSIISSTIDSNQAVGGSGGGVFVANGSLSMMSSYVSKNFAGIDPIVHGEIQRYADEGGGIAVVSEHEGTTTPVSVEIHDTFITGNTVRNDLFDPAAYGTFPSGGGLSVRGYGIVDVIDSTISLNRADGDLLYGRTNAFFRPPATGQGGGIRIKAEINRNDGQFPDVLLSAVIDPTTIEGNYSSGDGGGIFVDSLGDASLSLQLDDVTLTNNTAVRNGGGLYVGDVGDSGGTATIAASGCNQDDYDVSDGSEPTSPRDGLAAEIANPNPLTGCDESASNRVVLESLDFAEPEFAVDGAFLRIGMRPVSFATNDAINLFSTTWEAGLTRDAYNIGSLAGDLWLPANFPSGVEIDIPLSAEVLNDVIENRRLDIYVQDDTAVDFTELHLRTGIVVNRTTIDNNTATDGGGIWIQDAAITVLNSTLSANTATEDGGGIWSSQPSTGETKVRFTTIAENSASGSFGGGGIRNVIGGFDLESSIVTDNTGNDVAPDLSDPTGAVVAEFSLVSDTTGNSITSADGNIIDVSADLLPLGFNGGPTQTHAPSPTSPVVEGGNPEYKLAEDQRGYSRPGLRDMGPVESDGLPPAGLGDFNDDDAWDISDINALNAVIASGSNDLTYDMNGDGAVDQEDLRGPTGWLVVGGARNAGVTSGNAFILGDLNLDGVVDISDFNVWNANKFTTTSDWSSGDINSDGVVDISDYNLWNANKFQSSSDAARGLDRRIRDTALSELSTKESDTSRRISGFSLQFLPDIQHPRDWRIRNLDWLWRVDHDEY